MAPFHSDPGDFPEELQKGEKAAPTAGCGRRVEVSGQPPVWRRRHQPEWDSDCSPLCAVVVKQMTFHQCAVYSPCLGHKHKGLTSEITQVNSCQCFFCSATSLHSNRVKEEKVNQAKSVSSFTQTPFLYLKTPLTLSLKLIFKLSAHFSTVISDASPCNEASHGSI